MLAFEANYRDIRRRFYPAPVKPSKPAAPIERPVAPLSQEEVERARMDREAALVEIWAASVQPNMVPIPILAGISVRSIMNATLIYFGIREVELTSHRRMNTVVRPRQIAMYLARHHTTLSFPEIGRRLGGFDHTTVISGVRKITKYLDAGDFAITHDTAHIENILGIRRPE